MGRFDWELSGPMQILLRSCSLILFTYDKPDPKRVSACGCVAVTTSLRCIWKNRSTQNWLKLSATEPQAVNKSHRKDVAPGAGLSYPALARRHSSVGEDKASCMTRISLAGLAAGRENILSQYFQTHLEYTQGLPGWDSNFLEHEPFSALLHYRNRGKAGCGTSYVKPV